MCVAGVVTVGGRLLTLRLYIGVYYFFVDSVCLSVCPSVCLSRCSFKSILFFGFSMESSHFLTVSSPCGTLQNFSSIFDLGPLTSKIYSPKFYRPLFTGAATGKTRIQKCVMAATGNLCIQRLACGADLC